MESGSVGKKAEVETSKQRGCCGWIMAEATEVERRGFQERD